MKGLVSIFDIRPQILPIKATEWHNFGLNLMVKHTRIVMP